MSKIIPIEQFKIVDKYTPLISIDLVTICKHKVPLGRRVNKPAKAYYFTTGGIVRKNESSQKELGLELM